MGNWKMNGRIDQIALLLKSLLNDLEQTSQSHCVVFPPILYLSYVQELLKYSSIQWGAQNVYTQTSGAFTGEWSAPMLQDYGCHFVLVGHSERRRLFFENEQFIAEKFHHVKDHDMIPVLCIGETLEEREQGRTEEIIARQLLAVTQQGTDFFKKCVVAYEPVWAIGTGKTATPEQAQKVHAFIRTLVAQFNQKDAENLSIVYGGSVNENNAQALFEMPDIDGGLVGGASLNAKQFVEIVTCINSY